MDQDFHLIEKYFRGELSEEELQLFNQKLQKDAAFEQDFRDIKLVREGVKETARASALDILKNTEARLSQKETTKINVSMRRLVSIAASLLIIATVSYFAISDRTGGSMTGDEVFIAYYEPYINLRGPVRGENIEINTLSARAYNAYDIKDYSTSANLFTNLLAVEKSAENFFYSGIANLEAGNLDVAKNNLNTVMNNYTELREQAQWYLAMTLFKEGSEDEAIANVAFLSREESSLGKESKKLLSKMKIDVLEGGTGESHNPILKPLTGEDDDSPNGIEENQSRRWQTGTVFSFDNGIEYAFHNEYPIYELQHGDVVEFVIIHRKVKSNGKNNSFAVILSKLSD